MIRTSIISWFESNKQKTARRQLDLPNRAAAAAVQPFEGFLHKLVGQTRHSPPVSLSQYPSSPRWSHWVALDFAAKDDAGDEVRAGSNITTRQLAKRGMTKNKF